MKNKNDTRLKILSVVVAIFLWTFVVNTTNPTVNKVFRSVPVVIKNQDDLESSGYTIIGEQENYFTNIKLRGSREKLVNLREENIYASVDISDLREGVQSLQIEVDTPSGVIVDDKEPGQVTLNIQKVLKKTLPVNLVYSDQIKDGRIVEVNELSPKEITVKGPASSINAVDRVEAKIDDQELLDGKIHNIKLTVVNRAGEEMTNVTKSDEDVNVSFRVFETKKVPVHISTRGVIDKDYIHTDTSISPDSVIIKGPESIIRDIEYVKTRPLDINGIKSSKSGELKLDLPESVEVYSGDTTITYKIGIEKRATKTIVVGGDKEKEETTDEDDQ